MVHIQVRLAFLLLLFATRHTQKKGEAKSVNNPTEIAFPEAATPEKNENETTCHLELYIIGPELSAPSWHREKQRNTAAAAIVPLTLLKDWWC